MPTGRISPTSWTATWQKYAGLLRPHPHLGAARHRQAEVAAHFQLAAGQGLILLRPFEFAAQGRSLVLTIYAAGSLANCSRSLAMVAEKLTSRSFSCATTAAGARATKLSLPSLPLTLAISASMRTISLPRRSRSAATSISTFSISLVEPTMDTAAGDSGRASTICTSDNLPSDWM